MSSKTRNTIIAGWVVALASLIPTVTLAGPAEADVGPTFQSMGPLSFGPNNVLFAADNQAATIYALDVGSHAIGKSKGTQAIEGIDKKIASMLGTDAREIAITDIAVHPESRNTFVSVARGQGAGSQAVLLRVDGEANIDLVDLDSLSYTKATLPNAPTADPNARRDPRQATVTDMAFVSGRLWIAGLSNEEFASKLRALPFPFKKADAGTSVEIYHGAHGKLETRSPVRTFTNITIDNEPHLLAAYTCTPLVQFPMNDLKPGSKIRGTTLAELGNRNRPLDMFVYQKGKESFILIANNARGIMKVSTKGIESIKGIDSRVARGETAGLNYDTIKDWQGVEQLDRYNEAHAIVVQRSESAGLSLTTLPLP